MPAANSIPPASCLPPLRTAVRHAAEDDFERGLRAFFE